MMQLQAAICNGTLPVHHRTGVLIGTSLSVAHSLKHSQSHPFAHTLRVSSKVTCHDDDLC